MTERLEYMDIPGLFECSKTLQSAVDKGVQSGVYSLEEVERILVSLRSVEKSIELLGTYQEFVKERAVKSNSSK